MPDIRKRDSLYSRPLDQVGGFCFDERVAEVFPDMIRRSVPGYGDMVDMIGLVAERYAQPGSRVYDLGCSLGAAVFSMLGRLGERDCEMIAVDSSEAMIQRCRQLVRPGDPAAFKRVNWQCADVRDTAVEQASVVVLNLVLQFIPLADRSALLESVARGMPPGGVLVLSEKTVDEDAGVTDAMVELHHAFKRTQGYSELEISQKRSALEDVLVPESESVHRARLKTAGFSRVVVWYRCFNFTSFLAWK